MSWLEEIKKSWEIKNPALNHSPTYQTVHWLIARIERCESALRKVVELEVIRQLPFNTYSEALSEAVEALAEEDK